MPKIIRKQTFETNSSSCHSLTFIPCDNLLIKGNLRKHHKRNELKTEYPYCTFTHHYSNEGVLNNFESKLNYLVNDILNRYHLWGDKSITEYCQWDNYNETFSDTYFDFVKRNQFALDLYKEQYGQNIYDEFLHNLYLKKYSFGSRISFSVDIEKYNNMINDKRFQTLKLWLKEWLDWDDLIFLMTSTLWGVDHESVGTASYLMNDKEKCFEFLFNDKCFVNCVYQG